MTDPAASAWSCHTTPEGKKYYYNTKTRVCSWETPGELMSKISCPWTEHTAENGRKYYYNKITCEASWEMPPEFAAMKEQEAKDDEARKRDLL